MTSKTKKSTLKKPNVFSVLKEKVSHLFESCQGTCNQKSTRKWKAQSVLMPTSDMNLKNQASKFKVKTFSDCFSLTEQTSSNSIRGSQHTKCPSFDSRYPHDSVFILGETNKIIAKITKHWILEKAVPRYQQKGRSIDDASRDEKCEQSYSYFGERLRCNILLDVVGGNTHHCVEFAKFCDYVIAINKDTAAIEDAKVSAEIKGVDHKIDFIKGDFLSLKSITGDIVFLNPQEMRLGTKFSIFKDLATNIVDLVSKALNISSSIVIKLPGDTDIDELPILFNQALLEYRLCPKRFCVEIEQWCNWKGEIEAIAVYFGECSSIGTKEEIDMLYKCFANEALIGSQPELSFKTIEDIAVKIGVAKCLQHIAHIEKQSTKDKYKKSRFEYFLDNLVEENVLTRKAFNEIIEESKYSVLSPKVNASHVHSSSLNSASGCLHKQTTSSLANLAPKRYFSDHSIKYPQQISTLRNSFFQEDRRSSILISATNYSENLCIPEIKDSNGLSESGFSYSVESSYLCYSNEEEKMSAPKSNTTFYGVKSNWEKDEEIFENLAKNQQQPLMDQAAYSPVFIDQLFKDQYDLRSSERRGRKSLEQDRDREQEYNKQKIEANIEILDLSRCI